MFLIDEIDPMPHAVYAVFGRQQPSHMNIEPIIEMLRNLELRPEASLQPLENDD